MWFIECIEAEESVLRIALLTIILKHEIMPCLVYSTSKFNQQAVGGNSNGTFDQSNCDP